MNLPAESQRARPASFVALVLAGHSALGLLFAAAIYVLCLSGTLAVFANELRFWERPDGPVVGQITPAALDQAVRAGYERARKLNAAGDLFVRAPGPDSPRVMVQLTDPKTGVDETWLTDAQGRLVTSLRTPWHDFLIGLHYQLLVPGLWGRILVGIIGVFTLSLMISGVLAHPRIFKDAFTLRWGGSKHLQEADIHNRLSVWGLPFHLVIAFTGAALGLAAIIVTLLTNAAHGENAPRAFEALYGPGPSEDRRPMSIPDMQPIFAGILDKHPDATLETVIVQQMATHGQLIHVTTRRPSQLNESERHFFDGTGKWLRTAGYDDGPAGLQWTGAMTALHYGSFGGWLMKFAYLILGAALTFITVTGVTIWLARWNTKGRPRLGWQRVWIAAVWSQPVALGISALIALHVSNVEVGMAYLTVTALALASAAFVRDPVRLSRILRSAGAVSLLALIAMQVLRWEELMNHRVNWAINATVALLALGLGACAWRPRARTDRDP